MIDLILLTFVVCVFFAGFWAGKTFLTWSAAMSRGKAWVKALLN